jgi:hypothetical protein
MKPWKTLFIHTMDLENVQKNMKKEKGEVIGHQVSSNKMSKSLHVNNRLVVAMGGVFHRDGS